MTWSDFLDPLKQQVLQLAEKIQQDQALMIFEKETDIQYAHCKLALRLPEVKQQWVRHSLHSRSGRCLSQYALPSIARTLVSMNDYFFALFR
ncbi:hypothetical protein MNBD_GAMMA04-396 [hydrothermal vent metagenome]|uniref:Uncharacterized protein n=1 Tax=hydrothermal vent metagenome TaxID=652676 RepID=A0A3B0W9U3_9ZZZZ